MYYIWSILLYCAESWTLKMAEMKKLESLEMWVYRRILKISCTDHVTNKDILRRLDKNRELLTTIKRRKTAYFGHIMRGSKYQLLQLIIEGKIEGINNRREDRRQARHLEENNYQKLDWHHNNRKINTYI